MAARVNIWEYKTYRRTPEEQMIYGIQCSGSDLPAHLRGDLGTVCRDYRNGPFVFMPLSGRRAVGFRSWSRKTMADMKEALAWHVEDLAVAWEKLHGNEVIFDSIDDIIDGGTEAKRAVI